jgi:hypothetical protein
MKIGLCDMEMPRVSSSMDCHTNCVDSLRKYLGLMDGYAVVGVSEASGLRKVVSVRAVFVFANMNTTSSRSVNNTSIFRCRSMSTIPHPGSSSEKHEAYCSASLVNTEIGHRVGILRQLSEQEDPRPANATTRSMRRMPCTIENPQGTP